MRSPSLQTPWKTSRSQSQWPTARSGTTTPVRKIHATGDPNDRLIQAPSLTTIYNSPSILELNYTYPVSAPSFITSHESPVPTCTNVQSSKVRWIHESTIALPGGTPVASTVDVRGTAGGPPGPKALLSFRAVHGHARVAVSEMRFAGDLVVVVMSCFFWIWSWSRHHL